MYLAYIRTFVFAIFIVASTSGLTATTLTSTPTSTSTPIITSTTIPSTSIAKPQNYQQGVHYIKIPAKIRASQEVRQLIAQDPNKPQVIMFFNYSCFWCSLTYGPLTNWAKQHPQVAVYNIPVVFDRLMHILAKLYYTAQALDNSGNLTKLIYQGIHKDRLQLWHKAEMKKFFVSHGFSEEDFEQNFSSFYIEKQTKWANQLADAYEIMVTPNIVINGPVNSYLTNLTMTNGRDNLFKVIEFLLNKDMNE